MSKISNIRIFFVFFLFPQNLLGYLSQIRRFAECLLIVFLTTECIVWFINVYIENKVVEFCVS